MKPQLRLKKKKKRRMNKPQIDEYRLDIVDRLARIESTLTSVHEESRYLKLEIQMQNGRVRKLEGGMASIQGVFSVVSIIFGGFIAYLFKGR